jgi:hypothetical protein
MKKELTLLSGEKIIMNSDGNTLTLTNKRIRYNSNTFGNSTYLSITLDSVASCGLVTLSHPILMILLAISIITGIFLYIQNSNSQGTAMLLFGVGFIFLILYLGSRRMVISIASNGGDKILIPVSSMSHASIIAFLDEVEQEKIRFINLNSG